MFGYCGQYAPLFVWSIKLAPTWEAFAKETELSPLDGRVKVAKVRRKARMAGVLVDKLSAKLVTQHLKYVPARSLLASTCGGKGSREMYDSSKYVRSSCTAPTRRGCTRAINTTSSW